MIDNPCDHAEEIRELRRMIRELATHSGLGNSAISSGSLKVATPEGIYVKPGASIDSGDVKIGNASGVGSVKAGPDAEFSKDGIGIGGTKIGPDGKIGNAAGEVKIGNSVMADGSLRTKQNVNADGNIIAETYIQGRTGVYTPWEGGTATVESIADGIKTTATGAASAAAAAQSTANAAKSATDNHGPRIGALEGNDSPTRSQFQALDTLVDTLRARLETVRTVYNEHIDSKHSGSPKITF